MILRPHLAAALLLVAVTASGLAQKYTGPRPPKPDVPYLMHADNLLETEVFEAKEEARGNETTAWVPGVSSPVRTPMAEPIFLFESGKIVADKLELYKFEVKRGRREVVLPKKPGKNAPRPIRVIVTNLEGRLYRIEANETLENGEYSLSPGGTNQVFCFQVY
jgi:hypothetical protein